MRPCLWGKTKTYRSVAELNSLASTSNYWQKKRNKANLHIRYKERQSRLLVLLNTGVEHSSAKTFNNMSCAVLGLHDWYIKPSIFRNIGGGQALMKNRLWLFSKMNNCTICCCEAFQQSRDHGFCRKGKKKPLLGSCSAQANSVSLHKLQRQTRDLS